MRTRKLGLRVAAILGSVAATCFLSAGVALADNDTEGGGCEYGDASVNLMPSCDTSGGGNFDGRDGLEQVIVTLPPPLNQFPNVFNPG